MSHRPHLIFFKHTCSDASIYCKDEVPSSCPKCNQNIEYYKVEPFAIPYPLGSAKDYPCTILVRPSQGNFLDDYTEDGELHIGLTDSTGKVIEFDKCGLLHNDNEKWKDVLIISIIGSAWNTSWDETLRKICAEPIWNSKTYNDSTFNCFNFVISFLQKLKCLNIEVNSKEDLCKTFILPKIQNVIRYARIYRVLRNSNIYVEEN